MKERWFAVRRRTWLGVSLLIAVLPAPALACAVCGGTDDNGYFWGVLALMAMPFTVGSIIGGWLLYSYRRASHGLRPSGARRNMKRRIPWHVFIPSAFRRHDAAGQPRHA